MAAPSSASSTLDFASLAAVEDPINKSTGPLDAQNNYWGAKASAEMLAGTANISTIHDVSDDTKLPRVDHGGFSSTPVADAGPDW